MGKAPAFQFYPGDWRRDTQVQMASMETRGVWFEMLCCMWDAPERGKIEGTLERLSHMLGCTIPELERSLKEIEDLKIGNVTCHADVTKSHDPCHAVVTVINRRMSREESIRKQARIRKQRQRSREPVTQNVPGDVTLYSSSSSSNTPIVPIPEDRKNNHPPYDQIRLLWQEILPSLPQTKPENKTWHKNCKARYLDYSLFREQGIEWVRKYFAKIGRNPYWESGKYPAPQLQDVWAPKWFWRAVQRKED